MISELEKSTKILTTELSLELRSSKMSAGLTNSDSISRLQNEGDRYTRKIEQEKRRIQELETQIGNLTASIERSRRKRGDARGNKSSSVQIKKDVRLLENKLDKGLIRYNDSLSNNKDLREKIENARRDRMVFDGIYKKLERQLHEKKKVLALIIEESNDAYEARDKSQAEMQALKQRADKEQAEFEVEYQELGKLIEADRTIKDRQMLGNQASADNSEADIGHRGNLSMTQESNLKRKVARGAWNIAKDKAQMHLSSEKVQSYEEAFQQIQKATGITDIDELVTKFVEAEDKNFSLFNFVNELNSEIERLEMLIADVKSQIETFKGQGMNTDNQRKKILHDLDGGLQRTEAKADEYEELYQAAMKTINQLKTGIHSIFTRIGCNTTSVEEMLGNQGVTESNMMQYLGIIEQRTSEILQTHALNQTASGGGAMPMGGGGAMLAANIRQGGAAAAAAAGARKIQVQPPGLDDLSSEESDAEDDERPLTRDELTQKTLRGISKKDTIARAQRGKPKAN